jgi:fermentation-respiration switch protein FrsA (DUF1100 family)
MRTREVSFASDGITLAGHLRVPEHRGPHPAVVLTGPLSGVKEQVTGLYAEKIAAAGYVTLSFDHRNFGASGGAPRQHEDTAGKLHDLRDAVSFLTAQPEVAPAQLGCCGICLGGGYALRFAALDPRIRAVAGIAGGYNSPVAMRDAIGTEQYRAQLATFTELAQRQQATGETEYWAAVDAHDGRPVVMGGSEPADYYCSPRSACAGWVNQLTALSVLELITVDLAAGADLISPTPLLLVHGRKDEYTTPEQAAAAFDRAGDPRKLVWLDTTNHIDLYDVPRFVDPAVDEAVSWFYSHLRPR